MPQLKECFFQGLSVSAVKLSNFRLPDFPLLFLWNKISKGMKLLTLDQFFDHSVRYFRVASPMFINEQASKSVYRCHYRLPIIIMNNNNVCIMNTFEF